MRQLLVLFLSLATSALHAATPLAPAAPQINAQGYLLMDFHSGRVLIERDADKRMDPASLTKMMLTYIVSSELRANNIHLDDEVRVSEKAWRAPGSRMFVEVNTTVSIEDLLKGVIVQSGNDASIALAEYVAGSEDGFASIMNQYAGLLEMKGSHFTNSTGLPDTDHYTTPRDMAILARALIRDFPEHYQWYAIDKFTYNKITQYNRNRLLWRDKYVDGIKTGHTDAAGYCLVASALRDGMRLIAVIMGSKSEDARENAAQALLSYGFRFYETQSLYPGGKALRDVRIWKGSVGRLDLGLTDDLYVTFPRGKLDQLKTTLSYDKTIVAPTTRGQVFGQASVTLGDEELARQPLVALQDVPQGNWFKRIWDAIVLFFYNLFN